MDGEIVPNYDMTLTNFSEGDIVTGKVVRIDKDEVLVDIGYKSEGVIPVNELSIRKNVNTSEEVALDEEIDALVMTKEDADGRLILSKKRAKFEKAWKRIEGAFESGEPVTGTVIEVVKGGLILDLGVRGFLPASLVDIRRVQDLQEYVGQELNCRVIEMNRNRNNVVLSRRAVLEEERKEVRQQIIDELNVGDIVEGTISNIVDFGAFVDLDGIDGLIHISELSWTHINHPSEVLQVNQKVKVKVLDIDRDRQRISLGLKQTQEDPWQKIVARHKVGDVVEGRVTKIVAFGAFVEIYEGIEGLVHISELANRHVERPDEVVSVGQQVSVKIIEVDSERRRLSLSIKRVDGDNVKPLRPLEPEVDEEAEEQAEEIEEIVEVVEADHRGRGDPRGRGRGRVARPSSRGARHRRRPRRSRPASRTPSSSAVAAEIVEEAAEEFVEEHEPELGLSDDVFPAGAAADDERRRGDHRGLTPADGGGEDEGSSSPPPACVRREVMSTSQAHTGARSDRRHRLRQVHRARVPARARRRDHLERRHRPRPVLHGGRRRPHPRALRRRRGGRRRRHQPAGARRHRLLGRGRAALARGPAAPVRARRSGRRGSSASRRRGRGRPSSWSRSRCCSRRGSSSGSTTSCSSPRPTTCAASAWPPSSPTVSSAAAAPSRWRRRRRSSAATSCYANSGSRKELREFVGQTVASILAGDGQAVGDGAQETVP